jgi:hypothetical protein
MEPKRCSETSVKYTKLAIYAEKNPRTTKISRENVVLVK